MSRTQVLIFPTAKRRASNGSLALTEQAIRMGSLDVRELLALYSYLIACGLLPFSS
jgi:hypothetical protein